VRQIRADSLRWVVGILYAVMGTMMLVAPHLFSGPIYATLRPHIAWWGSGFLLSGVILLSVAVLKSPVRLRVLAHLLAGAIVVALAGGLIGITTTGGVTWIVLGASTAVAAFIPYARGDLDQRALQLLALVAATDALLMGLTMLFYGAQYEPPAFDPVRPAVPWVASLLLVAGLALLAAQARRNVPELAFKGAHLLLSAAFLAYILFISLPLRAWTGVAIYTIIGGSVGLLPWLGWRLDRIDSSSLETRLAFAFSLSVTLPLIVVVSLGSGVLATGAPTDPGDVNGFREASLVILLLLAALAVASGIYLARRLASPLRALADATRRMAAGDVTAGLPRSGVSEIANLSRDFDEMRERLVARTAERERLLRLLSAVLEVRGEEVTVLDGSGRILMRSRAARRTHGAGDGQLREASKEPEPREEEGVPPELEETLARRVLGGESFADEVLALESKEGSERVYLVSGTALKDENGRVEAGITVARDITEQRRLEGALRESERRERLLAELGAVITGLVDPVIVYDSSGRPVRANPAARTLFGPEAAGQDAEGLSRAISLRQPDGETVAPERLPSVRALRGKTIAGERYLLTDAGGKTRMVEASASPLEVGGRLEGAVATWHDGTEREQLLEEVQRRSAELKAAISSSADGLLIYSPTGDVVLMNPAAERILGYTEGERRLPIAERLALLRIETPEGKPFLPGRLPMQKALMGESVFGVVAVIHPPRREAFWVTMSAAPFYDTSGRLLGAVLTITDITPIRRLQEQRAKHVLGISHGLRTPLTVIQGQAQLLLKALDLAGVDGRLHRGTEAIAASAQRMGLTLRDLVDLTSLENGQQLRLNRVPVELPAFVGGLQERLRAVLPMERLQVEAEEGLPKVLADPDRLERVIANLLSNAFKFSEPDTEVTLRLSKEKGMVAVSVTDLGVGISPKQLRNIFDPYQRVEQGPQRGESMGLGLYLAKGLVEAMGGQIWVKSKSGKGSSFSFTMPLAREDR